MEKRKKKKIGEVEEEVDILHKMDNRCVFWSLCVLLKKKKSSKASSFRLEKNVFCSEKVLREITKTPTGLLSQKN